MIEESTTDLLAIFENTSSDQMDEYIEEHAKDLPMGSLFLSYIQRSDLALSNVYEKCAGYISKSYFYDLVNGTKKAPSRDIVIILCLAAGLNRKETRKMLENYGHRDLYIKDTRDIILATHINKEDTSIEHINEDLYKHNCRLLAE